MGNKMSQLPVFQSDAYEDGVTKQAFKDQTDINQILERVGRGETLSHLAKHGATYGDFSEIDDLLDAQHKLQRGKAIFDELPSEVRREFENDIGAFFRFVNDPTRTSEDIERVLPGLAKRGTQMPAIRRSRETEIPVPSGSDPSPQPGPENPAATAEPVPST